jgi:predicted Zn-dependent peptidase
MKGEGKKQAPSSSSVLRFLFFPMSLSTTHAPKHTVLSNGILVLVTPNPTADIIAARLFLRSGSSWEAPDKAGLANLLAAVLTKGTHDLSSLEIAERVEYVGAGLGTDASNDYFVLSLKTVSADFGDLLALAAELLQNPSFPEAEVELERRLALQAIYAQQEQPFSIAFDHLRSALYGNHPYAYSSLGTAESLQNVGRTDLQTFHQQHFRPDNLVISLAGRIEPEQAFALVDRIFSRWQIPADPPLVLATQAVQPKPQWVTHPQETQQAIVILGYLAPSVREADYAALKLISTYLGNGMSSRLFVELREKQGLAYEVSAFYPSRLQTSSFVTYIGTAPTNAAVAIAGLKQETERLRSTRLTADEIQASKNKLLGQYALGKQTNAQLAQLFGWYEILGLGIEYDRQFQAQIAAVTAPEIQAAACRYFNDPCISVVGPEALLDSLSA